MLGEGRLDGIPLRSSLTLAFKVLLRKTTGFNYKYVLLLPVNHNALELDSSHFIHQNRTSIG